MLHIVPGRQINHVQELAVDGRSLRRSTDLEVLLGENLEVDLVEVEVMALLGYVLNDPFLHRSLSGHDRRRFVGVEHHGLLACAYLGDEELSCLIILAEPEDAGGRHWLATEPAKPLLAIAQRSEIADVIMFTPFINVVMLSQRNVENRPGW